MREKLYSKEEYEAAVRFFEAKDGKKFNRTQKNLIKKELRRLGKQRQISKPRYAIPDSIKEDLNKEFDKHLNK